MKKTDKQNTLRGPRKRLTLSREQVHALSHELGADELQQAHGGTCYTDARISQCCPAG